MMTFLEWNDAIAAHFFREANAGRTVYLYVTPQVLEELGRGGSALDFIAAMQSGPSWATRSGLCQRAWQSMARWRTRGLPYPPYIGYLALFVLAAGHEGDFAPHAYYPRLRELLGEDPASGQYPSFSKMLDLWSDLEQWASRDKHGTLGILRLDIAGSWLHVGLPVAQTILTETERQGLHAIFSETGLDSDDPLPDAELARIIRSKGASHIRPRTLTALSASQTESEYSKVLLDRILEELETWTGTAADADAASAVPGEQRGTLLFTLRLDDTARAASFPLHIRLRRDGLEAVTVEHAGTRYSCRLLQSGYSTALIDPAHKPLDGAQLDWSRPTTLDARDSLTLRAAAATVRVFTEGAFLGISGYIETRLLDPSRPFAIVSSPALAGHIRAWGQASCTDFTEREVSGLPVGWTLFTSKAAITDTAIRDFVPQLSFARRFRRIRLEGGLRLPGSTQYYFRFAPPVLRLEGASAAAEVSFNEEPPVPRDLGGAFTIPDHLLEENTIAVSCADADLKLSRFIYLRDQLEGQTSNYVSRHYTRAGAAFTADVPTIPPPAAGVPNIPTEPLPVDALFLALEPDHSAQLIGARPGEVARYTPGTLPLWEPVWAVIHHRRDMSAHFIGRLSARPDPSKRGNTREVRAWKEILYHQRKKIAQPVFEPAKCLWIEYQRVAKNV